VSDLTPPRQIKVAVVTTHPIQYQVPWFRALTRVSALDLTVLYAMIPDAHQQGVGFSVPFEWDIPLLDGYRYRRLVNRARKPSLGRFFGCNTPEIGRLLVGFDAVIIHGWGVLSAQQALWAARRRRIPCIVRGEASSLRPWPSWRRLSYRAFLRSYDAFLAIGRANREFYARNGVPPERVFDAPYCVDNERFSSEADALEPRREAIRSGWGVQAPSIAILFSGKLIEKKRPLDLVNALAIARRRDARFHLLVAGDGPLRAACEQRARELGVPATFLGFMNQSRIAEAYVAADCLVLPSDHGETWGLVVNEAMACGRPAIVSDRVGCHLDLVLPGETGAVFRFGEVDELASVILSVTAAPGTLAALGTHARARVRRHYSIDNLVAGTLEALRFATRGIG
jgi:glycosyltransferase involved in cell wall biosynthesis